MNRRDVLQGSGALTLAAVTGLAAMASSARAAEPHDHHHHHHGVAANYSDLAHSATHCVMLGEACIDHCLDLLAQGDKSLAACAKSVEQLLAICNALRQMATYKSAHVPRLAKLAMDVCKECETECRKHKEHEACRACADACAECHKECAKVAA